jgi:putative ABC transport system permease protein
MNVFQLVLKQMRQRSLSTWLTLTSVTLGVALAVAIMILRREAQSVFGQTDYGYDVLVGPKASPLQLVLNTAYHIDKSPGVVPYSMYESLSGPDFRRMVRLAVPFGVGDSYKGQRIVGTTPALFGIADDGSAMPEERAFQYRPGKRYEIAHGRVFHPQKFEAVIGSDIQKVTGLKMGDKFKATHGLPKPGQTPDEHDVLGEVVGVLEPTHTANDRVLFIPLISFYAISEHEDAMATISAIRGGGSADTPAPAPPPKSSSKPLDEFLKGTDTPTTSHAHDDHDHDHDHHGHDHDHGHGAHPHPH